MEIITRVHSANEVIPVCSWCRKAYRPSPASEEWKPCSPEAMERMEQTGRASHGMCPDCAAKARGEAAMECTACKGTGKQTIKATENGRPLPDIEIECVWCKGTGEMTMDQKRVHEEFANAWCRCEVEGDPIYFERENGSHGYTCSTCGKITQTG